QHLAPRDADEEDGAALRAVVGADRAAVRLDDAARDAEAEAEAARVEFVLGRRVVPERASDRVSLLEQVREALERDAGALVGAADFEVTLALAGRDGHGPAVGREADAVRDQVRDALGEQVAVDRERLEAVLDLDVDL